MQLLQGWTILSYDTNTPTDVPGISDLICQLNIFFISFSLSETHNTHSGVQTETQLIEIHMPSQLKEKKNRKLSCDNNKNTVFNLDSVLICLRHWGFFNSTGSLPEKILVSVWCPTVRWDRMKTDNNLTAYQDQSLLVYCFNPITCPDLETSFCVVTSFAFGTNSPVQPLTSVFISPAPPHLPHQQIV